MHLENRNLRLTIEAGGLSVRLFDRSRDMAWELDPATIAFRQTPDAARAPCAAGKLTAQGDNAIITEYPVPGGVAAMRWALLDDCVEIGLAARADKLHAVMLPGAFHPIAGPHTALFPTYQGVLFKGTPHHWEESRPAGGHSLWSMAMAALLGERGGLMITQESATDWAGIRGQGPHGPYAMFEQHRSGVDGWYDRRVRLYCTDANITAVCKRFRARVVERGEFVPWSEKIRRKPMVENLFGALMAFIGYNKTADIDYIASARALYDRGFERVLYYPVRMCQYTQDFKMGGDYPIWLSDQEIAAMKTVPGALVAPWGWFVEALDDGTAAMRRMYRHDTSGAPTRGWKIDDFQWYHVCVPYEIEAARQRFASDMAAMDWIHYDVAAMRNGQECHNRSHELHGNAPLGNRRSRELIAELLGAPVNGNRIVSSEGFVDRYAAHYDIGTTKLIPQWGDAAFIPVPLTMLVFHDSCIHDWWEVHNYNKHPFVDTRDEHVGIVGSGRPFKKAAMDALYGCPPNVFPFGKQYGWVDIETRRTFSFLVRLTDAAVQDALAAALPVARLHKKIGMAELLSFDFVTDDHAVQTTLFSNGTRIVGNIGDADAHTPEYGAVLANSWVEVR